MIRRLGWTMVGVWALVAAALPVSAAPGDLDPTFGTGGIVTTGFGANSGSAHALLVQPDGKLVAAGGISGTFGGFAVARYTADGNLDPTFGTGGKVTTNTGDYAFAVARQSDGKLVVAGGSCCSTGATDFAVARYNPDGSLDTSFGTAGIVTTSIGSSHDEVYGLVVQPDGKIVAAGYSGATTSNTDFALVRYNADGSLDSSFGTSGIVTTSLSASNDWARSLVLQPDGKLLAAGYSFTSLPSDSDFALVRYNNDGSLDTSFGTGGKVITPIGVSTIEYAYALVLQPDGAIVAGGYSEIPGQGVFAMVRYTSTGSLDPTFGTAGKVTTPVSNGFAQALVLQPDGRLVAAGTANSQQEFALVRYNSDGSLDSGFGIGGKITTEIQSSWDQAFALIQQSDGRLVAAGRAYDGSAGYLALARYQGDPFCGNGIVVGTICSAGDLDPTFGSAGSVTTSIGSGDDGANFLAIQPDGNILATGYATNGSNRDLAVARYLTDGSLDAGFNGSGLFTVSFGNDLENANGLALQSDNKIVVCGYTFAPPNHDDFALFRLNSDGTLDSSFDGDGMLTTTITSERDRANAVLVQSDGKVVAVGNSGSTGANPNVAVVRYDSNGSLDSTFDGDGMAFVDTSTNEQPFAAALQSDGKIVVAGVSVNDMLVARFNTNGSLDTSFDGDGIALTSVTAGSDAAQSVAIQGDGKIVVAGLAFVGPNYALAVVRYHSDGSLDGSFGSGGKVTTSVGAADAYAYGVRVQSDGKIVVSGEANGGASGVDAAVVRYNADGSLDTSFGTGGIILTAFSTGTDVPYEVALDASGRIVIGGLRASGGNSAFLVARYMPTTATCLGEACDDGNTLNGDCCSATCSFESSGSTCTDGNVCTVSDQCNGSGTCTGSAGNAGAICRGAAGVCDVDEQCTGSSSSCPPDLKSTVVCRSAAGMCDLAESCDGVNNDCPADGFLSSSSVCRTSAGECDLLETCTGSAASCPADAKSSAVCRASAGVCDVAESCNGSNFCPADTFQLSTTVCRAGTGACDVAENCSGTSAACPSDGFLASGTVCRAAGGVCDLVEACSGIGPACPADAKSTALCRASVGQCDAPESCNGAANACPADLPVANGTACNSGDGCPADTCQSGVCQPVSCPGVDAVVLAGKPLTINIAPGKTEVLKTLSITVRNADAIDRVIALAVDASDCPAGVAGDADFDALNGGTQPSILVPAGKTKKAKVALSIQSAAFDSFNLKAPTRCTLRFTAAADVLGGNNDPTPSNNIAIVEVNVVDKNETEETATHETLVKSSKPTTLNIADLKATAAKTLKASVVNADYRPVAENPGDAIELTASTSCPGVTLSTPVCDPVALTDTVTVKGGATKTCKVIATADAIQVSTPSKLSPQRCTVTLTATGPSNPQNAPLDASNNTTELVLDVLDKNDN